MRVMFMIKGDPEPGAAPSEELLTVNRPSISLKGPVKVPQKEQCGPTPHPVLELVFEKR